MHRKCRCYYRDLEVGSGRLISLSGPSKNAFSPENVFAQLAITAMAGRLISLSGPSKNAFSLENVLNGETTAHIAARYSQIGILSLLQDARPNLFSNFINSRTPFHSAILGKAGLPTIDWFLNRTELKTTKDANGHLPIHIAAFHGHLSILQHFYTTDPEDLGLKTRNGSNVLHIAASNGQIETMTWLHDVWPELITETNNRGYSTAHMAVQYGQLEAVNWLLEKCPKLLHVDTNEQKSLIDIAAFYGQVEVAKRIHELAPSQIKLLDANQRSILCSALLGNHLSFIEWVIKTEPDSVFWRDNEGNPVVHYAYRLGKIDLVKKIVQLCPDAIRSTDTSGRSLAYLAVSYKYKDLDFLKWLHEKCPELLSVRTQKKKSLIDIGALHGQVKVAQIIHELASSQMIDSSQSLLFNAVLGNHSSFTEWAIKTEPSSVFWRDNEGRQLVHYAYYCLGRIDLVKKIIQLCPDAIRSINSDGRGLAHLAVSCEDLDFLKWLYAEDPKIIQMIDKNGENVMHVLGKNNDSLITITHWLMQEDPVLAINADNREEVPANTWSWYEFTDRNFLLTFDNQFENPENLRKWFPVGKPGDFINRKRAGTWLLNWMTWAYLNHKNVTEKIQLICELDSEVVQEAISWYETLRSVEQSDLKGLGDWLCHKQNKTDVNQKSAVTILEEDVKADAPEEGLDKAISLEDICQKNIDNEDYEKSVSGEVIDELASSGVGVKESPAPVVHNNAAEDKNELPSPKPSASPAISKLAQLVMGSMSPGRQGLEVKKVIHKANNNNDSEYLLAKKGVANLGTKRMRRTPSRKPRSEGLNKS